MILESEPLMDHRPPVTVKGTREGLTFLLDERADVDQICAYLETLITGETGKLFEGPTVDVYVDYGKRALTPQETWRILDVFRKRDNFLVRAWGSAKEVRDTSRRHRDARAQHIYHGLVRSGQPLSFDGDVVIIGDVNPSAVVEATGDIYVFGRLLGIAHAGVGGDETAVVAAAEFAPMQIRIADVVSRAPQMRATMEYAYLEGREMRVAEMKYFLPWHKIRKRSGRDERR
ncbi:septum site-determining protein MinC [Alicyclobacillus sendaiensis]|uniref:septum site-determining protein MinC n=1 Tax=Alicyclobacillus sendaiensis TaxID=192387 RepID=UPI000780F5F1|nr:septum site-determining protein MinC [Alicyclobacillus sendaiensis]